MRPAVMLELPQMIQSNGRGIIQKMMESHGVTKPSNNSDDDALLPNEVESHDIASVCHALLTIDQIERKTKSWKLIVTDEEWDAFYTARLRNVRETQHVIASTGIVCYPNNHCRDHHRFMIGLSHADFKETPIGSAKKNAIIEQFNRNYPYVRELLMKFHGRVVVAGGSLFRAATENSSRNDVDFFFVDPDVENSNIGTLEKIAKQNILLTEIIEFLVRAHMKKPIIDEDDEFLYPTVYITRSANVTTVNLDAKHEFVLKYQFVHRVYPSYASVIGGFDMGPAMLLYDGYDLMGTKLGVFSAMTKILILDLSRRSTTFESRILKYSHHTYLYIPGMSKQAMNAKLEAIPKYEVMGVLNDIILMFNDHSKVYRSSLYMGDLSKEHLEARYKETVREMRYIAMKNGFDISTEDLLMIPHGKHISERQVQEEQEEMVKFCRDHGFGLDFEAFEEDYNNNGHGFLMDNWERFLTHIPNFIKTKYFKMSIWLGGKDQWLFDRIHHGVVYETCDYRSNGCVEPIVKESRPHPLRSNRETSDYGMATNEDKILTPLFNVRMLMDGKIDNVSSILIFKHKGTPWFCKTEGNKYSVSLNVVRPYIHNYTSSMDVRSLVAASLTKADISDVRYLFGRAEDYDREHQRVDIANIDTGKKFIKEATNSDHQIVKVFESNIVPAMESLSQGPRWILENAGRQWTSAINPIVADVRDWYGEENYTPYKTGYEDVETCLRLARLRHPGFGRLPKDIFQIIVRLAIEYTANDILMSWISTDVKVKVRKSKTRETVGVGIPIPTGFVH